MRPGVVPGVDLALLNSELQLQYRQIPLTTGTAISWAGLRGPTLAQFGEFRVPTLFD